MKNLGKQPKDMGYKHDYVSHLLITRDKHPECHKTCACDVCLSWYMYDLNDLYNGPPELTLRRRWAVKTTLFLCL